MINFINTLLGDIFIEGFTFQVIVWLSFFLLSTLGYEYSAATMEDIFFLIGIWLTTIAFRFIYLQIPISWYLVYLNRQKNGSYSAKVRCIFYATSYLIIIFIASFFSELMSTLINPKENISTITLTSFASLVISPFITDKIVKN
ncbi:MAG: hypothetical protein HWE16_16505 [Gammaproteobacteria bacterium]|nr:hypothetical protein [Gammaproteobacteria bacterium]